MNSIVVGMGQIGTAVKAVTKSKYSIDISGIGDTTSDGYDVMHICFPYSENFIDEVKKYSILFSPKHVAVWSTVPIGTCGKIDTRVVHTPVEGRHPLLEQSIRYMPRFIGTGDTNEDKFFTDYFKGCGLFVRRLNDSCFTEALKLLSTTEYGINIEFARYKKQVFDDIGMDYYWAKYWNESYNGLYGFLGDGDKIKRYVLDPPDGPKGGHCVTSNARLLYEQYPDEQVKKVAEL